MISVGTNEQHGGCGYVEWHDEALPKFFSDLIGDLRDEVWRLRGQGNVARSEEEPAMVARGEGELGREMMILNLQDELRRKNAEIAAMKKNVLFVVVVFVVGLVAGKMLMP